MKRGDVVTVGATGDYGKPRPAVIVQTDALPVEHASVLSDFDAELEKLPGSTRARERCVMTSLKYLDTLYQGASSDPALQMELAVAYHKVAQIQGSDTGPNKRRRF